MHEKVAWRCEYRPLAVLVINKNLHGSRWSDLISVSCVSPRTSPRTQTHVCVHIFRSVLLFSILSLSHTHTFQNTPGTQMDWVNRATRKFLAVADCDTYQSTLHTTPAKKDICQTTLKTRAFNIYINLHSLSPALLKNLQLSTLDTSQQGPASLAHLPLLTLIVRKPSPEGFPFCHFSV